MALTKNELKYYSSLLQKKYRKQEKKFIIEGKRLVEEALKSRYHCEIIIFTEEFRSLNEDMLKLLKISGERVEVIKSSVFNKLSDTQHPQGIAAVFDFCVKFPEIKEESIVVALENISDPGNLGTILRNCDWFGVKSVILNSGCADVYNPKVLRASMGGIFNVKIFEEENFYDRLKSLKEKGYIVVCADMDGEDLFEFITEGNSIITMCNEANGPTNDLLMIVDEKITIPKFGKVESLNVASASAVILSQFVKNSRRN